MIWKGARPEREGAASNARPYGPTCGPKKPTKFRRATQKKKFFFIYSQNYFENLHQVKTSASLAKSGGRAAQGP